MEDDKIRGSAYRRWEEEGRPEGEHERHWKEAEEEHGRSTGRPQTMPSDHNSGTSPSSSVEGNNAADPSNDWPAADKD